MNQNNFYTIKEVAEKTGVHPQTIRNWEKEGLITPTRVAGQQRIFTDKDIERINEIMNLKQEGLQIKGIRNVLIGKPKKQKGKVGRPRKNMHMIAAAQLEQPTATRRRGRPPKVKKWTVAELENKTIKELSDIAQEMGIKYFRQMLKEELIVAIAEPSRRDEIIDAVKERTKERYGDKQYWKKDKSNNEEQEDAIENEELLIANTEVETENEVDNEADVEDAIEEGELVEANPVEEVVHETNEQQKLIEEILQLGKEGKTPQEIARILIENHKNDN